MLLHEKALGTVAHRAIKHPCYALPCLHLTTPPSPPTLAHSTCHGSHGLDDAATDRISIPQAWESPRQHTQVTCSLMRNQECVTLYYSLLPATRHTRSSTAPGVSASDHVMQPVKCSRREVALQSPQIGGLDFFFFSSAPSATAR